MKTLGGGSHSRVRPPPQTTGVGLPPSTAGSAEWLGSAVGNFILPWNWIIFGQVRLSYTKDGNGLLQPVGNGCRAPSNTDRPWAFLDSRSPFLLNRDVRTDDLYATAAEGVSGSNPHSTPTLPWPHTTHPVVMAIQPGINRWCLQNQNPRFHPQLHHLQLWGHGQVASL